MEYSEFEASEPERPVMEQYEDMSEWLRDEIIAEMNIPVQKKVKAKRHKKHKFLMLPMEGSGHVLNLLGFAYNLLHRYHSCVFAVAEPFAKYFQGTPFKVKTLNDPAFAGVSDPQERWAQSTLRHSVHFPKYPDKQLDLQATFYDEFVTTVLNLDNQIEKVIREERPDFILVDYYVTVPAVVASEIPWAHVVSCNPLCVYTYLQYSTNLKGPPMYSGYGFGAGSYKWDSFKRAFDEAVGPAANRLHDYATQRGVQIQKGKLWFPSLYCNFYVYPFELDYTEISRLVPRLWLRMDHFIRPAHLQPIGVDLALLRDNVKKIYFTLGSMGSADVNLMNNLLKIFGEMPYQFIVSTGPNHEQIKLPANAIGGKFVNQLKIIPRVDCVIFHGGNNTLVECCFRGKPTVILPLFGDQFDNATRVVDRQLGYSFCPYELKKDLLLKAVYDLLNDPKLKEELVKMQKRMKKSRTPQKACVALETILTDKPLW